MSRCGRTTGVAQGVLTDSLGSTLTLSSGGKVVGVYGMIPLRERAGLVAAAVLQLLAFSMTIAAIIDLNDRHFQAYAVWCLGLLVVSTFFVSSWIFVHAWQPLVAVINFLGVSALYETLFSVVLRIPSPGTRISVHAMCGGRLVSGIVCQFGLICALAQCLVLGYCSVVASTALVTGTALFLLAVSVVACVGLIDLQVRRELCRAAAAAAVVACLLAAAAVVACLLAADAVVACLLAAAAVVACSLAAAAAAGRVPFT